MVSRNYDLSQTPSDSILIFPDIPASPPAAGSFLGAVTSSLKLAQLEFFNPGAVYVPIAGGTMTGPLILSGDPAVNLGAATKQYADKMLPLAGGQMTGFFALAGDATQPLQPVTLQQLNTKLNIAGGTMTGLLLLSGDPTNPVGAATKRYVDNTTASGYLPLTGGTLTGPLTLMGGDTLALVDPRIPALAYAWQDTNSAITGAIGLDGTLSWSLTNFTTSTIGTATINAGTATLTTLNAVNSTISGTLTATNFTASGTITLPLGSSLVLSSLTVSNDVWGPFDPRISGMGYSYGFFDPNGAMAGGITYGGTLAWGATQFTNATITTLAATTATLGAMSVSGALSVPQLTVGDTVWGPLDPRLPAMVYAWLDMTGAVGAAIAADGTLKMSLADVATSLTLNFDATSPNHALRKAYADTAYINAAGGTMVGALILPTAAPVNANQAVNKAYVDSAAASGGAGGLAGLATQRDFPYPPLRDPKRDFGAIGDGVTDDSSPINQCVDAALAAGERAIAINDPFYCPNLKVESCNLVFIGNGSLKGNKIWKWPIPPWAPTPPRRVNTTLIMRKHCPGFTARVRASQPVVVVQTGDSGGNPNSNGFTGSAVLWARVKRCILEQNPGINCTFFNRSIGGQQWQNLDGLPSATNVSWYTTPSRAWLLYIQDCNPDLVIITLGAADSWNFSLTSMLSVLAKMRAWVKPPDVIFVTSQPVPQATQTAGGQPTPPDNANFVMNGDFYATSINRSYALSHGIGMIDTFRTIMLHRTGVDFEDMPLLRDTVPTGGYVQSRVNIPLPYTWPTPCFGYGGYFYININSWTNLGNEVQFEIGNPAASNGGNIFRIGRDTASGNVYYQVDTTTTAAGAAQNEIFIPKTIVPNWPTNGGDHSFQFSVCGSQLILSAFPTPSTPLLDQYLEVYAGPVPRIITQWQPRITCTAGAVSGRLYFEKAADTAAHALTSNPHPRAMYWQTLTDYEANGPRSATPDMSPWGGGGTAHSSVLSGILCIQSAVDSCDFSAGA